MQRTTCDQGVHRPGVSVKADAQQGKPMQSTDDSARSLRRYLSRCLEEGKLSLGQLVRLTPAEQAALRCEAIRHQRKGRSQRAIQIYGLLLGCEPLSGADWAAMAALQEHLAAYPVALACYEAADLLGHSRPTVDRGRQRCLRRLQRAAGAPAACAESARPDGSTTVQMKKRVANCSDPSFLLRSVANLEVQ